LPETFTAEMTIQKIAAWTREMKIMMGQFFQEENEDTALKA
jgi:hypothetical protein